MTQLSPKVSVCMVTYNQEGYVTKCIESILNQTVNFEYEIIIADDNSTDSTKNILNNYALKYPDKIRFFSHEKNIGPYQNFAFAHGQASGEYVAHIDGDDYMLDGKLQAQADYLDQHPDCNIVWHRMNSIINNGEAVYEDNYAETGVVFKKLYIADVVANVTLGFNSSKMYRSSYEHKSRTDYNDLDFPFNVVKLIDPTKYAAFTGDSIFGVYRSSIGISFTHNYQIKIKIYKWLIRFYNDRLMDRSLICGKILLLLLSDIKHRKKTMFYGIYAFLITFKSFSIKSLRLIHSKKVQLNTRFKVVEENIKV